MNEMLHREHQPEEPSEHLPTLDRREFMRATAGGALVAAGIIGCGGGGDGEEAAGGTGGGAGEGSGGTVAEQRNTSILAIEDYVNSLPDQPQESWRASVLSFVQSQPAILAAGRNIDGVWVIYPDGVPLMILDNRLPDDEPAGTGSRESAAGRERRAAAGSDVPAWRRARLINTMGSAFADELPWVHTLVEDKGYVPTTVDGTITNLMQVVDDGIFYISAHGGICEIPQLDAQGKPIPGSAPIPTYGIWTSERRVFPEPQSILDEFRIGTLAIMNAPHRRTEAGFVVRETHYAITDIFVQAYMNFGHQSLVWFSACNSLSTHQASVDFVQSCINKKAGLVVGWTNVTNSRACRVAGQAILDRLLGSNPMRPQEVPPQRPFDYERVWDDIRQHPGLYSHPVPPYSIILYGKTTEITYKAGNGSFGLLAPSIEYVLINEVEDKAVLKGIFGNPADTVRKVTIGGRPVDVNDIEWTENKIICKLERSGLGSAGDVKVIVREHESNVRQITEWNIPMTYTFRPNHASPLKVTGQVFVRFRADVGAYRAAPHEAPIKPLRAAIATRDSDANLTASGVEATDEHCRVYWENQQVFPAHFFNGVADRVLVARFKVDTAASKAAIGLDLAGFPPQPFTVREECDAWTDQDGNFHPATSTSKDFGVSLGELYGEDLFPDPEGDPNRPDVPMNAIQVDMPVDANGNSTFRIPAGVIEDLADGVMRLEWTAVNPQSPPDPQRGI